MKTADLFPNENNRIVPHDEGRQRLAAIRNKVAIDSGLCQSGGSIYLRHDFKHDRKCVRCGYEIGPL